MQITTTGKQMELTEAIEQYVDKKIQSLEKFSNITRAKVTVGCETHHHNKGEIFYAECILEIPGSPELFAKQTAKDLYAAVDILKDELTAVLKKNRELQRAQDKKMKTEGREVKEYHPGAEEEMV